MKKKIKVGILFGGKSGEHEVSIVSATNVFNALDKEKYDVTLVGIDKDGRWLLPDQTLLLTNAANPRLIKLNKEKCSVSLVPFEADRSLVAVGDTPAAPASTGRFDVVLPILHGTYGEDGTIQGLLELANVPYVGSGVLGSAAGMDKDIAKKLFQAEGIPVVPGRVIRRHEFEKAADKTIDGVIAAVGLPFFVKPANMGSSVGVHKVKSRDEAAEKIKDAFRYDTKILAEKAVNAREIECAVLGNNEPKASIVGEIVPTHEFYSYEAKYMDENGAHLKIPADGLTPEMTKKIQDLSVRAFRALELRGLARVDFFLDKTTGDLFLNEVNTIPGFTQISMYPKLWMAAGMTYAGLLDELIRLALERHAEKNSLKTSFDPSEN
ncbi:MAG: D-alanine--D-alanine ligase [Bdellovibrionaceae bacterium]|nr:D-alanine--D-alanine ligase [Pseudobdellovibrionaceae bacterium]MBX3034455.1 D-alanine--D-alanine ligase [Pseudobdellovibrionaceae bacterium]